MQVTRRAQWALGIVRSEAVPSSLPCSPRLRAVPWPSLSGMHGPFLCRATFALPAPALSSFLQPSKLISVSSLPCGHAIPTALPLPTVPGAARAAVSLGVGHLPSSQQQAQVHGRIGDQCRNLERKLIAHLPGQGALSWEVGHTWVKPVSLLLGTFYLGYLDSGQTFFQP